MRRRDFLNAASATLITGLSIAYNRTAIADNADSELVLLGTAGGPLPHPTRSSPASALLIGDSTVVIDCGYGVARQLVRAGISPKSVSHIFITHNHSDHYADVVMLPYLAWIMGLQSDINIYGPPPIAQIVAAGLKMHSFDIETRMADEGFPDLRKLLHVHEIEDAGIALQHQDFAVTAARNNHPPVKDSFAYRFDMPDRTIVFSGDTTYSDEVVELSRNADVLLHEVLYVPAIEKALRMVPTADKLRKHLLASHTTVGEVGKVASAANVGTLVLSHLAPPFVTNEDSEQIVRTIQAYFSGKIIVGEDLLRL